MIYLAKFTPGRLRAIAELEELHKAATPAPWGQSYPDMNVIVAGPKVGEFENVADAELVGAMRNRIDWLLSAARRASALEERNGKLEELLRRVQANHWVVVGTLLAADIDRALAPSTKGEG